MREEINEEVGFEERVEVMVEGRVVKSGEDVEGVLRRRRGAEDRGGDEHRFLLGVECPERWGRLLCASEAAASKMSGGVTRERKLREWIVDCRRR